MPSDLTGPRGQLADRLFDIGAVNFGAFRIKLHETQPDAPLSPIYMNLRTPGNPKPGPLDGEVLALAADLYREIIDRLDLTFSYLAGIPRAGDPFADALAATFSPPARVLRLGKEEHDGGRRITGLIDGSSLSGDHVLLVEDLITQADSKLEAIRAVEACGGRVSDIVLLIDREQGGTERVRHAGYDVHSVYRLSELLEHYVATGRITQRRADEVSGYVGANR